MDKQMWRCYISESKGSMDINDSNKVSVNCYLVKNLITLLVCGVYAFTVILVNLYDDWR